MPIIVITAQTSEAQRVAGLDCGADDYVTKPFSIPELLARIRAQLRRRERLESSVEQIVLRDFVINLKRGTVQRHGKRIELSYREFELLRYLIDHRGDVVSRERLLQDVLGLRQLLRQSDGRQLHRASSPQAGFGVRCVIVHHVCPRHGLQVPDLRCRKDNL